MINSLLPYIDAFNIDNRAFTESFYKNKFNGRLNSTRESLLDIKWTGKHPEFTNLLLQSKDDDLSDFTKMVSRNGSEFGKDMVLHLSGYFPSYKSKSENNTWQFIIFLSM